MPAQAPCPTPEHLRDLLDGHLPEPDQRQLVRHLDECANCQQALEGLAANAASWSEAARLLTPEGGPDDPRVTADLPRRDGAAKAVGADGETISLAFLAPPREAGHLGRLGHYEVLEVVGSGGFGIVLKAFDETLHRVVAIKVMAPQLAAVASARKRFSREARSAAAITHEHVVAIHAVEEANDPPYLVMQYVAGTSLQERLDRTGPMQVKEILRIGMQAAQGLAAAHAQGVIHRDIKPANILLENGVERVKLTDFGLARMADDASVSQSGVIAGTPLYMAPEQARGEELDARADLFSLGSVLYAMCTGHPPFRAGSPLAVLRRVCEETPRPVREVNPDVPEWLAEVVAKLHEKDPDRRFQSAAEVADLLGRHLAHLQQPTLVAAPGRLRPGRPSGRNVALGIAGVFLGFVAVGAGVALAKATMVDSPLAVVGSAVLGVGVMGVAFLVMWLLISAWVALTKRTRGAVAAKRPPAAKAGAALAPHAAPRRRGAGVWVVLVVGCFVLLAGGVVLTAVLVMLGWVYLRAGPSGPSGPEVTMTEETAMPMTRAQPQLRATLNVNASGVRAVAFSSDGKRLVAVSGDAKDRPGGVELWDARPLTQGGMGTARKFPPLKGPHGVRCAAFSPDSSLLATGECDNSVRLRDPETGAERFVLKGQEGPANAPGAAKPAGADALGHGAPVTAVAFTPDGQSLVTASLDGTVKVWDLSKRRVLRTFRGHEDGVTGAAVSHDGKVLASGGLDRTIRLGDVSSGRFRWSFGPLGGGRRASAPGHLAAVESVAFSPIGLTLASGCRDGTVGLWDAATGQRLAMLRGHSNPVCAVAFAPDGRTLASGAARGEVRLWDVAGRQEVAALRPNLQGDACCVAFSRDGQTLAAAGWGDRVFLWDLRPLGR